MPLDRSALWVLVGPFPYLLLTASTVDGLPAGPSRYLYVASAGSSLLLATVLQWIYRRWRYLGALALGRKNGFRHTSIRRLRPIAGVCICRPSAVLCVGPRSRSYVCGAGCAAARGRTWGGGWRLRGRGEEVKCILMRSDAFRVLAGWRWPLYAISMVIVCVICLGHLVHHPVDIDDESYFSDSADVLSGTVGFFSPQKRYSGRPFTEFILLVAYAIVGANPAVLHVLTVCLHLLTSLLLCHLTLRMGNSHWVSMGAGFLFLISVSHFRAVFWISAVAYPLSLSLGIVSIIAYLLFDDVKKKRWLLLSYATSLLAVMSHIALSRLGFFAFFSPCRKESADFSIK